MNKSTRPANRLAHERSPYLLQHAHNPVDWMPWSEEAFERARREDKPVFLSIGYSACHWCHVMERESFEDEATAKVLNEHFVSVKVDREERPDIDQIYQLAHQVLSQRGGGWPLSVFLTPDKRPFFAGTYFPRERRFGLPGFREVLLALAEAYRERHDEVVEQASEVTRVLERVMESARQSGRLGAKPEALEQAVALVMQRADLQHGGFGRMPKFPNTMTVDLLMIAAVRGDEAARRHAALTLERMARGGIHDHLGGGFARYSTDAEWLIPHFEKMLYDNAQLARLYLDGWRLFSTGPEADLLAERAREVVEHTLAYVEREMTAPGGEFYSAQDADSEGEEGRFFVWTPDEIQALVGPADARLVCAYFGVTAEGNFEHGRSVLWTPRTSAEVAKDLGTTAAEIEAAVERALPRLFEAREKRPKPLRDDKCLASWNALMISAMADAGASLGGEGRWTAMARRALEAWRTRAFRDGRLAHAMKDGEPYGTGYLDDYAGMACAAIDLYEAEFDPRDLAFARVLCDVTLDLFWDEQTGEFYYTPSDAEVVLARSKDPHDHAYPGGVGLAADMLLRLWTLTGVRRYRDTAERLLEPLAPVARDNPMGMATLVRAADRLVHGAVEIVIVGDAARPETRAMLLAARSVYVPHRAVVCVADEAQGLRHGLDPALVRGRAAQRDGAPTAYVCLGTVCDAPLREPAALAAILRRVAAN